MSIFQELQWRGLVADCTDAQALQRQLQTAPCALYCGFDPTADSLHVGHLVPLLVLRRFQLFGHRPIAVAGGATGSIGDPSGKSEERQLLTKDQIKANVEAVRPQMARLLDFDTKINPAKLLDNADWTAPVTYLDFLRDIGKFFSVNMMVAKESVRARMENREAGISYTEFSYMLLQAFDFLHLCQHHDCLLQVGGSDQWGNITAGSDLCRKKLGRTVYGLTLPLVTKADGTKFGKTEAGAVWLDPKKSSVYRFYQFWIRALDQDVIRYLRFFTFLSQEEVAALDTEHAAKPEARLAHKALARAVTGMIHGEHATREAIRASEILFGGGIGDISEQTFQEIVGEVSTHEIDRTRFDSPGLPLIEGLVHGGLCPSKGQARKDAEGGGIYLNNVREANPQRRIQHEDLLFGKYLLLRKGKRTYALLSARS